MAAISITESEILAALAAAFKGNAPKDARTTLELSAESGIREPLVRRALQRFKKEGRLVVHMAPRELLDGRTRCIAAYTILPKKGK